MMKLLTYLSLLELLLKKRLALNCRQLKLAAPGGKKREKIMKLYFVGLCCLFSNQLFSETCLSQPLGVLVDVDGHKMHLYEMGTGPIPVIMDSCLGSNVLEWSLVQPQVAQFAHCITHDRSGLGWSEPSDLPRTSKNIVEELRTLLRNIGIYPPYILVGHSSGGINMRLFANLYPEEVYGLVLVDSSYEEQIIERKRLEELMNPSALNSTSFVPSLEWLPEELRETYQQLYANPREREAGRGERLCLQESFDQIRGSINGLCDKPLIVITRGSKILDITPLERKEFEEAWHVVWMIFQDTLVKLSDKSEQIIVHGAGHMIQRERPDIIIEAIYKIASNFSI
jgi:pimeloyl-ACP methyl ester carboxylesterase